MILKNDVKRIATVSISFGDIKFKRRYAVLPKGDIRPFSPMLSSGIDSGSFNIDKTIFFRNISGTDSPANKPTPSNENVAADLISPVSPAPLDMQNIQERDEYITIVPEDKHSSMTEVASVDFIAPPPVPLMETQNFREIG